MIQTFKVLFTYEQDDETGEVKVVNREVVINDLPKAKKTSSPKKSTKKADENPNPELTLEDNKYCLNTAAVELLGVEVDDRLDIKFEKRDKVRVPVIGCNTAFGTQGGNRLTKSNTVSYRGKNHDLLEEFGTVFSFKETDKDGIFELIGDKPIPTEKEDENVKIVDEEVEEIGRPEDLVGIVDGDATELNADDIDFKF
jgi:hypothetical protein